MKGLQEELIKVLDKLKISKYGITNIYNISNVKEFNSKYSRAISLGQAYSFTLKQYSSKGFNDFLLGKVKNELENNIKIIEEFLIKKNIKYHVVTNLQKDRQASIGEFSHKFAAVQSGLGWIGKNGLLITKEYGPRIRLSTILVDIELPVGSKEEYTDGCCECNMCVDICPAKCLKGGSGYKSMQREDIVDIYKCKDKSETRKGYICGLCLIACPVGESVEGIVK